MSALREYLMTGKWPELRIARSAPLTFPGSTGTVKLVLEMREKLVDRGRYGPYRVIFGKCWEEQGRLAEPYLLGGGVPSLLTLRDRLLRIETLCSVESSPYLDGWQVLMMEDDDDDAERARPSDVIPMR